jgi:broad specificity phosphatase PhoE
MIAAFAGRWESDPLSTELRGSLEEMEHRVRTLLGGILPDEHVLVISHGAYIRAMKSILETGRMDAMNRIFLDNGERYTFPS